MFVLKRLLGLTFPGDFRVDLLKFCEVQYSDTLILVVFLFRVVKVSFCRVYFVVLYSVQGLKNYDL